MDVHEASPFARCCGNRTERVGGGVITVDNQRCFGDASVLIASTHSEQHGHVKVRLLRQWRPVLSRYEAPNPGQVTTRSAGRILATQVDSSGIEDGLVAPSESSRSRRLRPIRSVKSRNRSLPIFAPQSGSLLPVAQVPSEDEEHHDLPRLRSANSEVLLASQN